MALQLHIRQRFPSQGSPHRPQLLSDSSESAAHHELGLGSDTRLRERPGRSRAEEERGSSPIGTVQPQVKEANTGNATSCKPHCKRFCLLPGNGCAAGAAT